MNKRSPWLNEIDEANRFWISATTVFVATFLTVAFTPAMEKSPCYLFSTIREIELLFAATRIITRISRGRLFGNHRPIDGLNHRARVFNSLQKDFPLGVEIFFGTEFAGGLPEFFRDRVGLTGLTKNLIGMFRQLVLPALVFQSCQTAFRLEQLLR